MMKDSLRDVNNGMLIMLTFFRNRVKKNVDICFNTSVVPWP